jgi:LysR family transcriptional regulator, glycine cleavage system transcriptional activator
MPREIVRQVDRLQRLVAFDAAARLGSFTAAALELGLSQPAVTRQIRSLEGSLGTALFVRTANRSELTDAGRRLWGHVAAGFDTIEGGIAELAGRADTFVLAAHPGIAQQWLVPRIDGLRDALGGRELRLRLFDRDDELTHGGYDACIRVGDGTFHGQTARLLFPEVVVPVAAPPVATAHGLDCTSRPDALQHVALVHMDDGDRPWMTWHDWFGSFGLGFPPQPGRVLFQNYPMVLQQALAGRGVALGWRPLIDDLVDGGALVVVGPEVRSPRGYYVTWRHGPPSRAVAALVDWLDAQVPPVDYAASGDHALPA